MEPKECVEVVQAEIVALRQEVAANIAAQGRITSAVILGVAGAIALRQDVELDAIREFLPIVPVVALAVISYMLAYTAFLFRASRQIARNEIRINELAGKMLLDHETNVWSWRIRWFPSSGTRYAVFSLLLSVTFSQFLGNPTRVGSRFGIC